METSGNGASGNEEECIDDDNEKARTRKRIMHVRQYYNPKVNQSKRLPSDNKRTRSSRDCRVSDNLLKMTEQNKGHFVLFEFLPNTHEDNITVRVFGDLGATFMKSKDGLNAYDTWEKLAKIASTAAASAAAPARGDVGGLSAASYRGPAVVNAGGFPAENAGSFPAENAGFNLVLNATDPNGDEFTEDVQSDATSASTAAASAAALARGDFGALFTASYTDPAVVNAGAFPAVNAGAFPVDNTGAFPAGNAGTLPAGNAGALPAGNAGLNSASNATDPNEGQFKEAAQSEVINGYGDAHVDRLDSDANRSTANSRGRGGGARRGRGSGRGGEAVRGRDRATSTQATQRAARTRIPKIAAKPPPASVVLSSEPLWSATSSSPTMTLSNSSKTTSSPTSATSGSLSASAVTTSPPTSTDASSSSSATANIPFNSAQMMFPSLSSLSAQSPMTSSNAGSFPPATVTMPLPATVATASSSLATTNIPFNSAQATSPSLSFKTARSRLTSTTAGYFPPGSVAISLPNTLVTASSSATTNIPFYPTTRPSILPTASLSLPISTTAGSFSTDTIISPTNYVVAAKTTASSSPATRTNPSLVSIKKTHSPMSVKTPKGKMVTIDGKSFLELQNGKMIPIVLVPAAKAKSTSSM